MTLPPEVRAALQRAWRASIEAEIAGRSEASEQTAERAVAELFGTFEQMAVHLTASERPGERETTERLRGLVRARDWAEIDTVRLREDRSHAEVVALLFSIGDRAAGERYLKRARAAIVSSLQA
jgi:hypothetical protein